MEGEIKVSSAKNSVLAIMCSCLMIRGKTVLDNVPKIEDVERMIEVFNSIGAPSRWISNHQVEISNDGDLQPENINIDSFSKTRIGLLLIGALTAFKNEFSLPCTTGCNLGKRTVNPHILALEDAGVEVMEEAGQYKVRKTGKKKSEIVMYESGDTATENAILAAVLAQGEITLYFASSNYMVQDLCIFLQKAGARIEGIGATTLKITGVGELSASQNYPIMPDPIEAMTFISLAITTKSPLTIAGCPIEFLRLELEKLRVMGQKFNLSAPYKSVNGWFDLVDISIIPSKLHALPDKIYGRPYPGLNIDNLPLFLPILTQAEGESLVHDWAYENRAIYYTELNRFGANISLHDPHRVSVKGPTILKSAEVICPPALRPSVNLLICMLAAPGISILRNGYPIKRGYENLVERLRSIGAEIEEFGE